MHTAHCQTLQCTLHHTVSKYSDAGNYRQYKVEGEGEGKRRERRLLCLLFPSPSPSTLYYQYTLKLNYRLPCFKKCGKVGKPLLSFSTSRANPSRLGFRKARTLNLSQAKCSFYACQSPHWLGWKRSTYKKKNGDRCWSKASAWPKRVSGWFSSNHHSIVSSPIPTYKASMFRWKNDLSNDAFEYAVEQKLKKLWLFKGVCTKRSASLEWSCFDGREEKEGHRWDQHRKRAGVARSYGCDFMQARASVVVAARRRVEERRAKRGGKAGVENSWSS